MIAFVFPGQGSQRVGMGQALAQQFPECRETFEQADAALGMPISTLCFEGPSEQLMLTQHTQPALVTVSVAAQRALTARGVHARWLAGHSLGEYSAHVAAGTLSFGDALRTVCNRGRYMQEAVPVGCGGMAAVLGLDETTVVRACREAADGQVVSPANLNAPGQIVIAGASEAVKRACDRAKALGARRVLPLPVSAPFHCALMQPAQERLAPDFALAGCLGSGGPGGGQSGRRAEAGRGRGDCRPCGSGPPRPSVGSRSCAALHRRASTRMLRWVPARC